MKIRTLSADRYRSLCDVRADLEDLNLFIGANASGKSTILDALRFMSEGVRYRDFRGPVYRRGGIVHLAWKGEDAGRVLLKVNLEDGDRRYDWSLRFLREGYDFHVEERVDELRAGRPPEQLLFADSGEGWWWSGKDGQVSLKQAPTACALAAAAADATFPAREVADFVGRWGIFDPNPFLLRRDWTGLESGGFDPYGRNLAETLFALEAPARERIVEATRSIVGLPERIEPRESREEGRYYFVQSEPGLRYFVHQMGVSSGTLRVLALMTALFAGPEANLVGIEEPENNIHPAALAAFAEHVRRASGRMQIMVTTHSPALLDVLDAPEAVRVVRRGREGESVVVSGEPGRVREALVESGFGLGEYYETTGFGTP